MNDSLRAKMPFVIGATIGVFLDLPIVIQTVLILMAIDFVVGIIAAVITNTFSGRAMGVGMLKKFVVLMMIYAAAALARGVGEQYNFDASAVILIVGGAYCVYEMRSLVKNAHRCGVPAPEWLVDKLRLLEKDHPQSTESPQP